MQPSKDKRVIKVLDKGYVRLVAVYGSDLTVVNAARVSYDKQSFELGERDIRLIKFLAREGHTSPFRHVGAQFEVYAPLMIARQWWKYVIGSDHVMDAWNESSRRYVSEELAFYVPEAWEWRSAPGNKKQGSGAPVDERMGKSFTSSLKRLLKLCEELYQEALKNGICPEQARLFLPAYGLYVRWYWSASLQSITHLLNQRLADDTQKEFQEYAKAIHELTEPYFPVSIGELVRTASE